MEENKNIEQTEVTTETEKENSIEKHTCECTDNKLLKLIICAGLILLGSFCAAYVLIDWHMKSMFRPFYGIGSINFERQMNKDLEMMDKMIRNEKMPLKKKGNVIHLEQTDDLYKIIVDLRPFDNDKNNIDVNTENNVLTISGRSVRKNQKHQEISRFQQSYMFGDEVKLSNMRQNIEGHYFVITIPIENDKED